MKTIRTETQGTLLTVTLDRPELRNAFNEDLISELTAVFGAVPGETRTVILTGAGGAFCAGADVDWMKRSLSRTEGENARDARAMAGMFRSVDECPVPVIARVNGPAIAGGSGLVAACDIAIASRDAVFGFTEVRLGIIPAVISTYVLPKIGPGAARRYFLTGERFGAAEALSLGLVHEVAEAASLDERIAAVTREILQCGPQAVRATKRLIREAAGLPRGEAIEHTIRAIAGIRVTPEAQEGLGAFLEKRKPNWT